MGRTWDNYIRIYEKDNETIIELWSEEDYEDTTAYASGENDYCHRTIDYTFNSYVNFLEFTKTGSFNPWRVEKQFVCDIVEHYQAKLKSIEGKLKSIQNNVYLLERTLPEEYQRWDKTYKNKVVHNIKTVVNNLNKIGE